MKKLWLFWDLALYHERRAHTIQMDIVIQQSQGNKRKAEKLRRKMEQHQFCAREIRGLLEKDQPAHK
jgi:hypothetical protein